MSQASEYVAGAPAPGRVHVGEPKDLFPAPFVGQRVALRTPSRGQEVRLFTVAKVSEADGDVVAELERVGPIGSSTERFDVLWRVREFLTEGRYPFGLTGFVDIRSRLPPKVAAVTNAFREDDVQAMPWHPLPPAVMPAVTAAQAKTFLDGVADFLKKDPASIGIELRGDAGVHMRCGWSEGRPFVVQFRLRTHPLTADDVAAYRALAPEGAEEALQRPYPAVGEASVLSLGRFPGLECYTDCPDWATVDPVGEAPRGDFHNLTARLSTAGEGEDISVVVQVAPWWLHDAPLKAGDLLPLRLCDFACPGNAFLAQARLGSEHVPVLTNLAALPNHAIVSKPYTGGFLTQSCTWRPDVKLLRDTEAAGLRLDQPGHAMAPPCNARDTPFDNVPWSDARERAGSKDAAIAGYKALVLKVEEVLSDVTARQYWLCDYEGLCSTAEAWTSIREVTAMAAKNGSVLRSWGEDATWAETEDDIALYERARPNQTLMSGVPSVSSLSELRAASASAQDLHIDMDADALRARDGYILSALLTTDPAALRVLGRDPHGVPVIAEQRLEASTLYVFTGAMAHGAAAYQKTNTRVFWYAVRKFDNDGTPRPLLTPTGAKATPSKFFDVTNFMDGAVYVQDEDQEEEAWPSLFKIWPMTVGVGSVKPKNLPAGTSAEGDGLRMKTVG